MIGELSPDFSDVLHKMLRIPIGNVNTNKQQLRDCCQDTWQTFKIFISCSWTSGHVLQAVWILTCEFFPFFHRVILVDSSEQSMLQSHSDFYTQQLSSMRESYGKQQITLDNALAISKVPTVSMFEAITGIPL